MGAALWSWFLVGSEGNVRQWSLLARRRFCPSVPWCFAVSESPAGTSLWSCFEGMGAALWSWFLVGLKATLGSGACLLGAASVLQCHGVLLLRNRSLELRCETVLRARELHFGAGFLSVQKLGTGACLLGAASVLQCHGVLLFRNRPLELRCGAVLRAWELHFGTGFLSVQKATLRTGACLLGAVSVLHRNKIIKYIGIHCHSNISINLYPGLRQKPT